MHGSSGRGLWAQTLSGLDHEHMRVTLTHNLAPLREQILERYVEVYRLIMDEKNYRFHGHSPPVSNLIVLQALTKCLLLAGGTYGAPRHACLIGVLQRQDKLFRIARQFHEPCQLFRVLLARRYHCPQDVTLKLFQRRLDEEKARIVCRHAPPLLHECCHRRICIHDATVEREVHIV